MERGVIAGYAPMAYTHEQNGVQYKEYRLNKRDTLVHSQMIQNWIMSAKIRMLAALTEDESKFGGIYLDAYGREQDMSTLTEQPASAKEPAAPDAQPRIAVDKRAIQCGAQLGKVLRLLPLRPGHAGAHADLRLLRAAGLVPFLLLTVQPLQDARVKGCRLKRRPWREAKRQHPDAANALPSESRTTRPSQTFANPNPARRASKSFS